MNILKMTVLVMTVVFASAMTAAAAFAITDPASSSSSPSTAETNNTRVIQGELLKIEGEFYVVKEKSGQEVRLRVDKETVVDGRIQVGDKVDAQVLPDGRAATILKAS